MQCSNDCSRPYSVAHGRKTYRVVLIYGPSAVVATRRQVQIKPTKTPRFDTRTRTGTERTDEVSMGNHDTVKELSSLVQQAQLRAGVKSNRGSGNCAESRTHSFMSAMEKFLRDNPSTILHSEGTLSNQGQQPRTGICAQV